MLLESLGGMMRIVCKWLGGTFGGNGLIFTLFVLAAGDRLGVDLGVPSQTIVSLNDADCAQCCKKGHFVSAW